MVCNQSKHLVPHVLLLFSRSVCKHYSPQCADFSILPESKLFHITTMGKDKRKSMNESQNGDEADESTGGFSYADHMKYVSVIAQPMASEELTKKVKIYLPSLSNENEVLLVKSRPCGFFQRLSNYDHFSNV